MTNVYVNGTLSDSTGPISESDLFTWEALIIGPKDTPFEGGVFAAKLTFVSSPSCYIRPMKYPLIVLYSSRLITHYHHSR